MRNPLAAALALVGLVSLTACGKKSSTAAVPSPLSGTWKSACIKFTDVEGANSRTRVYTDTTVVETNTTFDDDACAQGNISSVIISTYTIGADVSGLTGVKKFDSTVTRITVTPLNVAAAGGLNNEKICGFTDWAVNVSKDIKAACDSEGKSLLPGDGQYDIFKIDGNKLTIGDDSGDYDRSSEAKRPIALDSKFDFTKS